MAINKTTISCIFQGCANEAYRQQHCKTHYRQGLKDGTLARVKGGKGCASNHGDGYIVQHINGARKKQHTHIAEKALGRVLPNGAVVHHVNENKSDNRNENLVVCPDAKYHKLLHVRQKALDDCGDANHRKCTYCKKYDDIKNMAFQVVNGVQLNKFHHSSCLSDYNKRYRENRERISR